MTTDEMLEIITNAETAMRAAQWEIGKLNAQQDALRKCLFELAYTAQECGLELNKLTNDSQNTIVELRLGGFANRNSK